MREARTTFPIDYANHVCMYIEGVDVYLSVWRAIEDQMVWKKGEPSRNSRRSMARNDKGREKTKNDWSIERFESWRKVLGYERVKKVVESWPRLIRCLTKDANSLETDLHRSL